MAQITLKIRANNGYNGTITNKSTTALINNVSKPLTEPTTPNNGVNGKSLALGYLSLADGFLGGRDTSLQSEVTKYNGYMFGATNNRAKFDLSIELTGENIKSIIVRFDKAANQYATIAQLDGNKAIYNDSYLCKIVFDNPSNRHIIKFTEWSRANYNACIIGIDILTEYISYSQNHIDNVESTAQVVQSGRELSYGVIANTGSANLIDRNYEIKELIEEDIIPSSNLNINLFVNDKQIQSHIVTDSDYDTIGQSFTIQFTNDISQWDKITYAGRGLQYDENDNVISSTAWKLLVEIMSDLGYTETNLKSMCDEGVEDTLKNITIPYPYLESDTYRATIDKICILAQLNVFANEQNVPFFVSARPLLDNVDKGYVIPTSYQITQLKEDVVLRNQYDGIDIEKNNIKDVKIVGDNVYNWKSTENSYTTSGKIDNKTEVSIEVNYWETQIQIPKISDDTFSKITRISDVNYIVTGKHRAGKVNIGYNDNNLPVIYYIWDKDEEGNIKYDKWSGKIETFSVSFNGKTASVPDETNISISEQDSYFNVSIKIPVSEQYYYWGIAAGDVRSDLQGYIAQKLEISMDGDKRVITFNDINASTPNITSARTVAKVQSNELMQTDTIINQIKDNILSDYSNGIKTANVDIFCGDFENAEGDKLNFAQGDIIKPYDIIALQGDNDKYNRQRFWRVISRDFKYDGQPTLSLNLQGAKYWHTVWSGKVISTPNYPDDDVGFIRIEKLIYIPFFMDDSTEYLFEGEIEFNNDTIQKFSSKLPFHTAEGNATIYLDMYNQHYLSAKLGTYRLDVGDPIDMVTSIKISKIKKFL